jgi:hypothetical protein
MDEDCLRGLGWVAKAAPQWRANPIPMFLFIPVIANPWNLGSGHWQAAADFQVG